MSGSARRRIFPPMKMIKPKKPIESLILNVRGQKVILDTDLAELYGVTTKVFNQAMKRNADRFPEDFMFQLEAQEFALLRSQIVTSNVGRGGRRYAPYAFTEHGAIMAATVLNSPEAVAMSVFVVRAFMQMRERLIANAAILKRLAEIDKTLLEHDSALNTIWTKLQPLLAPPPDPPRPEIGFHIKEDAMPYRTSRKRMRPY